ncbi:hypothetical protein DdX_08179 [Ditylenchus destructor]|uniref:Uncharacterized protein n=1 Tax=Ditylenchus destructor TaxID=166010 RepID=A0AAD4R480_9BILA|nr:hypothetical protein DdX_08179 [Ditylenchus destructor]
MSPMTGVSPIYNDPKYRCCCNTHVERGAYIIAFVGATLCLISTGYHIYRTESVFISTSAIQLLLYLSIIYAQKRREPWLYWPYLILTGLGLFLLACYIILAIVCAIILPGFWVDSMRNQQMAMQGVDKNSEKLWRDAQLTVEIAIRVSFAIIAVICTIVFSVSIWFYSVVYRAYKYMKDEQSIRVAPPTLYKV